ncbi:D-beta-hydroxybutyrate dehydrogenase [Caballeronia glathei]|jgi:3-hydroxybutyrate dehydrogenase|uniref:3-hydroxybutyrate dehydrogenase n=1 Tax=Caballeronia glathei TaxID=60547 RepID=A0A069PU34_9BURK|nr:MULTISPECIES: 3-hydroxybutyrate dehydrogenase [Burkholderiaceae]KDR44070.1 3-hydroxybutyrate dehydrogenase [Caballeronia glathei]TCK38519.1 3-hydroxybutyrate dehydrogenase [Paraburkholderia sp. BL8N3]CDY75112.1 D-beta-hydroxybutyrate dehydrogenase [Caballeronia glathei]
MTSPASKPLAGKTALVTGSTSGIGLGIATALAQAGANLVLNGFGDSQGALAQIEAIGVKAAYHGADMSKPAEIEAMIAFAADTFGAVDVLVNNAGIQHVATVDTFPVERWDAIIAINLSSAFHTMRVALPAMRERGWGRVINIASVHGLVGSAGKSAYVAAKHGIVGLTKVAALENARTGVTVNAICPGFVLTPLVQKQIDDLAARESLSPDAARAKLLGDKQPSAQFVTPQQIGDMAVFLCSDGAAEMRGSALTIDGGWSAQ